MTSTSDLVSHLRARHNFKPSTWVDTLETRKREELEFHNFEREKSDAKIVQTQQETGVHANKKYYSINAPHKSYLDRWLETNARGKVFLDYACGNGDCAIRASRAGAEVAIGLDISDVSLTNARNSAQAADVSDRCHFVQGDCEATELPDNSIDVILCSGMLHHLDLEKAYPELLRILKPGGKILAAEALAHNPLIQFYRDRTPHMRTEWETKHILRMQDIRHGQQFFKLGEIRFWHLFTLGAVPFRRTPLFRPLAYILGALDFIALKIPGVRLMAWQVTFELIKPPAAR